MYGHGHIAKFCFWSSGSDWNGKSPAVIKSVKLGLLGFVFDFIIG